MHVEDSTRYPRIYRHEEGKQRGIYAAFADGHVGFVPSRAPKGAAAVPDDNTAYAMFGDLRAGPVKPGSSNYQFTY